MRSGTVYSHSWKISVRVNNRRKVESQDVTPRPKVVFERPKVVFEWEGKQKDTIEGDEEVEGGKQTWLPTTDRKWRSFHDRSQQPIKHVK